ncbi:MAG: hypothetical protein ACI8QZ_004348 [Chlamydiales bacterium]|jgi:hypothetical protein
MSVQTHLRAPVCAALATLAAAGAARAQDLPVVFSVDWHGPSISLDDTAIGVPITEADLLFTTSTDTSFGPLESPGIRITGGELGLSRYSLCSGHAAGMPCGVEVDAISFGKDKALENDVASGYRLWFTTDEYAVGDSAVPAPSIASEAMVGDISADILVDHGLPPGPLPPAQGTHAIIFDGNGLTSMSGFATRGIGLIEPNVPGTGLPTFPNDLGDNVDAIAVGYDPGLGDQVFFSVDAGFLDPAVMINNSNTASFEQVSGGDVLVHQLGAAGFAVYAQAAQLGLERMGAGTDDLDAMAIAENGITGFQPSQIPYDWVAPPPPAKPGSESGAGSAAADMLLFSVRRGSALIGRPDSIMGLPIEAGDILTTPLPIPLGGQSLFPGIFIAAENLGFQTIRSGGMSSDEMNGLGAGDLTPYGSDCNNNSVEDSVDISCGASMDTNMNGIPDECELAGMALCACSPSRCGNDSLTTGCLTSTGIGAVLGASGTSSVFADDLVITASDVPLNKSGLFFMGGSLINAPFGDGRRCVGSGGVGTHRFYPIQNSGPGGTFTLGPGLTDFTCTTFVPAGCIDIGETWHFQAWFRDPMGPCGNGFNLTSSWSVLFTP